jgi:hypothetical protein
MTHIGKFTPKRAAHAAALFAMICAIYHGKELITARV